MKFNKDSGGNVIRRKKIANVVAVLAAMLGGAVALAQADKRDEARPATVQVENEATSETTGNEDVIIRSAERPVITARTEEEVWDSAPDAPKPPKEPTKAPKTPAIVLKKEQMKETALEQRMERLERMIEDLSEHDGLRRKNAPFEYEQKEFGRVQKEIERAGRDAEIAVKRLRKHPRTENDFVFEHKIEIAGNAKMQRKALEAQRKALEKQIEALNRQLQSLEQTEEGDQETDNENGKIRKEQEAIQPSLPPE